MSRKNVSFFSKKILNEQTVAFLNDSVGAFLLVYNAQNCQNDLFYMIYSNWALLFHGTPLMYFSSLSIFESDAYRIFRPKASATSPN